jgi:phosphoesterase
LIGIVVLLLGGVLSSSAQVSYPEQEPYQLTKAMKGVKRSTDIVAVALPAAALVGTLCARDWEGLLQGVETAAVTAAFTYALKYATREERPDRSDLHSFPSGHTAVSFAASTYLTRRYGWKFGVPAYIASTYVAWGRCFSRQHYVWDCVVGAAIGAGSALIFTTPFARRHDVQISPVADERTKNIGVYASFTF